MTQSISRTRAALPLFVLLIAAASHRACWSRTRPDLGRAASWTGDDLAIACMWWGAAVGSLWLAATTLACVAALARGRTHVAQRIAPRPSARAPDPPRALVGHLGARADGRVRRTAGGADHRARRYPRPPPRRRRVEPPGEAPPSARPAGRRRRNRPRPPTTTTTTTTTPPPARLPTHTPTTAAPRCLIHAGSYTPPNTRTELDAHPRRRARRQPVADRASRGGPRERHRPTRRRPDRALLAPRDRGESHDAAIRRPQPHLPGRGRGASLTVD